VVRNLKLIIEYDGSHYHGWQRQPNAPSIQQTIETAIETMTRRKIVLIGSGRTDAGVHALGQTANFTCDSRITAEALQKGLNSLLPPDIVVRDCRLVTPQFHARYDATRKTYRYCILNDPLPSAIGRQYAWWIRSPLDLDAMQEAAALLLGTHDFKSFEASGSPRAHSRRHILQAQWERPAPNRLIFNITADGFLRHMVRNIVGTLVDVGLHKLSVGRFKAILASRDRALASGTAPARGLFLVQVFYD
jgi:tRNA pseudouridine38-40 synthase